MNPEVDGLVVDECFYEKRTLSFFQPPTPAPQFLVFPPKRNPGGNDVVYASKMIVPYCTAAPEKRSPVNLLFSI